jgi:hypothetical protein
LLKKRGVKIFVKIIESSAKPMTDTTSDVLDSLKRAKNQQKTGPPEKSFESG